MCLSSDVQRLCQRRPLVSISPIVHICFLSEDGSNWTTSRYRIGLFITQHLILVVSSEQIVDNMHQAYERIDLAEVEFGIFVSGPSKTADIEQSLVIGAHGARSLTVVMVNAS